MSMLVANCPRCRANSITFDVRAQVYRQTAHGWQNWYEVFCVCRACARPTIFLIYLSEYNRKDDFYKPEAIVSYSGGLNAYFKVDRYISLRDLAVEKPPEYLPKEIEDSFNEGATCLSIGCYNAAATMFRLCIDLTTKPLLPDATDIPKPQPTSKSRRDLGLRLAWLFDNGLLPNNLRELARCVREDANDGAHVGNLRREDAEDLLDFTRALLERLMTEPKQLELAEARRVARRSSGGVAPKR